MDDTKTIQLKSPVTLKGDSRTYDSITLCEPTVAQLDASARVGGSTYASNAELIRLVADVPLQVVRQMKKTDYEEAVAYLAGFTWQPPQSSEISGTDTPTSPTSGDGDPTTSES